MAKTSFFSEGTNTNVDTQDFLELVAELDQRNAEAAANNQITQDRANAALGLIADAEGSLAEARTYNNQIRAETVTYVDSVKVATDAHAAEVQADITAYTNTIKADTTVLKNAAADSAAAAGVSLAATQAKATEAATSATNAASSASTASTKASEAAASATAAAATKTATDAVKTATEGVRDQTTVIKDAAVAAKTAAETARDTAATQAANAATSASTAATKATQLAAQLASFNEIYLGKFASAPTVDGNGNTLKVGAIYENTTVGKIFQWESDLAWHAYDEESQAASNNAVLSANNAASSASSALTSKNDAAASATSALTSKNNAGTSETNAASSASSALTSKNAAKVSEDNAKTSETNAAASAATAQTAAAGQVNADWLATTGKAQILNKPVLAAVATSGSKADVGLSAVENKSSATIRSELTSGNINTALGFTPQNITNLNQLTNGPGYQTTTGQVDNAGKVFVQTDETNAAANYLTMNRGGGVYAPQYNSGKLYFTPSSGVLNSYGFSAEGNVGFYSRTYAVNQRNPIWRFGNADPYGLSYFQGTSGLGGVNDSLGIHLGTATAAGSQLNVSMSAITATVPFTGPGTGLTGTAASLVAGKASRVANTSGGGTAFNWAGQAGTPTWVWGANSGDPNEAYVWNPANFSVNNAANLGGVGAAATMQKRRGEVGNTGPTMDAVLGGPAEYGFAYSSNGSASGPFLQFGGLGASAGNYAAQFSLAYNDAAGVFRFRTRNDDAGTTNPWRDIWHTGNLQAPSVGAVANTLVVRGAGGYIFGNYLNMTDDGNPGTGAAITSIITKRGDDYYRAANKTDIKAFLGVTGADVYSVRSNTDSFVGVCREMMWKNYGNSHTIIDASAGTSPSGSAIDRTNSANVWTAQYPTLMGWNGSSTYGVRVDSARVSDTTLQTTIGRVGTTGPGYGSYGSINIGGQTGGYGGFSLSDFNMAFMLNRTYQGAYRDDATWLWRFDDGVLNVGTIPGARISGAVATANKLSGAPAYTNGSDGWWRSQGTTGWFNETYSGGIYMADATYIRTYAGKDFYCDANILAGGNVTAYSDERLKENWKDVPEDFIEKWAQIKAGTYDRKDSGKTQVGVSAQSVQKVLPDAVETQLDGYLSLNYGGAAAVATVELAKEVLDLKAKLARLEALVAHLV